MKNLQNYSVHELNAKEIKGTYGGGWPWVAVIGVSLMVESAVRGFVAGFKEELKNI